MPGFPVHYQFLELAQTHVHWVADGSFPMSQFFTSSDQSTGASASASVLPINIQDWFPLGLTGLISLLYKGLSRIFSSTKVQKLSSLAFTLSYGPDCTSVHDYWKTIAVTLQTSVAKWGSAFNTLCRFFIAFLPSKEQVSFNFVAAVKVHNDSGAQENKICHCFHFFPMYLPWSGGTRCCILVF